MTQAVRVGLFGAGMIGREHAKYIAQSETLDLVAVADPMPAGADIADEYGLARYEKYADLLADDIVDAVIVALPNSMHADAAIAAIDAGVVPLVEKPIAGDLAGAERIVAASERTGVPVLVGHQRRYAPDVVAAREFIARGGLGRVVSIGLMSTWRKDDAYFDAEWRTKRGAGPILINFIHDIDVARFLLGDVEQVVGIGSSAIRGFEAPDTAGVVLRFASGAIGTGTISDAAVSPWCWDLTSGYGAYFPPPPPGDTYFISGTEAAIALPSLTVYRHDGDANWKTPFALEVLGREDGNAYAAQLEHFARVVRGEEDPVTTARDGFNTLAVAVAVSESLESGAPVTVQAR